MEKRIEKNSGERALKKEVDVDDSVEGRCVRLVNNSPIHHHCPHAISNSNVGGRAGITGYPLEFRNCASALVRAKTLDRKCNV